jgi:hypothetical protein
MMTRAHGRLDQVEKHVRQLFESSAEIAMLTFIRAGPKVAFNLLRSKGLLTAAFTFSEADAICEHIVRKIFAKRGIVPTAESIGGVGKQGIMLTCSFPGSAADVSSIATEVLRSAYGISDHDSLDFLFNQK